MRNQILNPKSLMFLVAIVLLTYGVQGISYGQVAPTVLPGDNDTSLCIEFPDRWFSGQFNEAYYLEYRKKTPQGPWVSGCFDLPISVPSGGFHPGTVLATIYRLEPGTTYQVRYNNNTGNFFCDTVFNISGPWSEIGEGTTSGVSGEPDLVVEQPIVSKSALTPGENFTLSVTVRNEGTGSAAATTLRYYRSTDATISTGDTEVGTDSVSRLGANGNSAESITLTAPTSAGTYYYGACVEAVTGESSSANNCSDAVSITVSQDSTSTQPTGEITYSIGEDIPTLPTGSWFPDTVLGGGGSVRIVISGGTTTATFGNGGTIIDDGITYTCVAAGGCTVEGRRVTRGTIQASGGGQPPPPVQQPDLVVETPTVSQSTLTTGDRFTLSATVRNAGVGSADATTLRYYRSTDTTILTSDTEVGTDSVSGLGANESSAASITLTAPTSAGTYYYGACVDAVADESSSDNNHWC